MRLDQKLLVGLIIVKIYTSVYDLLTTANVVKMSDYHARPFNIFFSLTASILILSMVKHRF